MNAIAGPPATVGRRGGAGGAPAPPGAARPVLGPRAQPRSLARRIFVERRSRSREPTSPPQTGLTRATGLAARRRARRRRTRDRARPARRSGARAARRSRWSRPAGRSPALGMEVNVDYIGGRAWTSPARSSLRSASSRGLPGPRRRGGPRPARATSAGAWSTRASAQGSASWAACLGLPGLVDRVTGPLLLAPNLGWRDVDVVGRSSWASDVLPDGSALVARQRGQPGRLRAELQRRARARRAAHASSTSRGEVGIGARDRRRRRDLARQHGWSGEIGHRPSGRTGRGATAGRAVPGGATPAGTRCSTRPGCRGRRRSRTSSRPPPAGYGAARAAVRAAGVGARGRPGQRRSTSSTSDTSSSAAIYARLADLLRAGHRGAVRVRTLAGPWSPVRAERAPPGTTPRRAAPRSGRCAPCADDIRSPCRWTARRLTGRHRCGRVAGMRRRQPDGSLPSVTIGEYALPHNKPCERRDVTGVAGPSQFGRTTNGWERGPGAGLPRREGLTMMSLESSGRRSPLPRASLLLAGALGACSRYQRQRVRRRPAAAASARRPDRHRDADEEPRALEQRRQPPRGAAQGQAGYTDHRCSTPTTRSTSRSPRSRT